MARKQYVELVNDVLVRLRENEVGSVNQTAYSKLIGKFLVDAQRQVEDSYNWNALTQTLNILTVPEQFSITLQNSGIRFRVIDVINDTSDWFLNYGTTHDFNDWFLNKTPDRGSPRFYNFNGVDLNGDTQVDVYPIPDKAYQLRFNLIVPQQPLRNDNDRLFVPEEPVLLLAYAKALAERGEDGGMSSSEAYGLYLQSLGDHISNEMNKYPEELLWDPV
jgi:hypothetical protein